jgi:molecular chaperone DnaK
VKDLGEQLDEASKREIEDAIKDVRGVLESDDVEDIRAKTDRLQTAFHKVSEQMYERAQAEQAASTQSADGAGSENGGPSSADEEVVDAEVVDEQK